MDCLERLRRGGPQEVAVARDGPLVLAFCRETLRAAGRVERGDEVSFDTARQRYAWGVSPPAEMGRMRWFLREGWGTLPHYGMEDAVVRAREATLVVPCLGPRRLAMTLRLEAARAVPVGFSVNTLSLLLLGIIGYFLREYHLDMQRRMTRTEEVQAKHDRRLAELLIVNKIQTRMISKLAGEENPELIRALRPEDPDSDAIQK